MTCNLKLDSTFHWVLLPHRGSALSLLIWLNLASSHISHPKPYPWFLDTREYNFSLLSPFNIVTCQSTSFMTLDFMKWNTNISPPTKSTLDFSRPSKEYNFSLKSLNKYFNPPSVKQPSTNIINMTRLALTKVHLPKLRIDSSPKYVCFNFWLDLRIILYNYLSTKSLCLNHMIDRPLSIVLSSQRW